MTAKVRSRVRWFAALMCAGFTLPATARADESQDEDVDDSAARVEGTENHDRWVDDPYQAHDTSGPNVRLGSAVGFINHDDQTYTALGGAIAVGPRFGRFTIEAEYVFVELSAPGPATTVYGNAHRIGVLGRADLLRLGSHTIGPNSMLAVYDEAGLARQLHHWFKPGTNQTRRTIPVDGGRSTAVVGFGINLDHRLEQPRGFPTRVGWQLGWQLTASDRSPPGPTLECRGPTECVAGPVVMMPPVRNTSLLVTSTIGFTW